MLKSASLKREKVNWAMVRRNWFYKLRDQVERLNERYSKVGAGTFFDASLFPWSKELEENWEIIRQELDAVLKNHDDIPSPHEISSENDLISNDKRWKTYLFYVYSHKVEENLKECPETARLLANIPGMTTAFFSILAPYKMIPKHRGPYNGVIRYHLGLKVPQAKEHCKIFVDADEGHWEEGKALIFDDSYIHHVWNATNEERVVLFLDVIRPLPFPLSLINRLIIYIIAQSEAMQEGKRNLEKLKKK